MLATAANLDSLLLLLLLFVCCCDCDLPPMMNDGMGPAEAELACCEEEDVLVAEPRLCAAAYEAALTRSEMSALLLRASDEMLAKFLADD